MKALLAIMAALLTLPGTLGAEAPVRAPIDHTRAIYAERCGGCHGLNGRSAAENVPDLAGRAGYFLCSRDSRAFAARLPNVIFARLPDEDLAAVLNYVMFDLGGASTPAAAKRYTAREIAAYRPAPLAVSDLHERRRAVVEKLVKDCGAPPDFLAYDRPRGKIFPVAQEKP